MLRYTTAMVGFASSPRFIEHDTGPHHPERPDRIRAILKAVRDAGLIDSPNPFPEFELDFGLHRQSAIKLTELAVAPAELTCVLAVHPQDYIDRVRHVCEIGGGILDQGDTPVCQSSYEIAMLSAGCAITATESVLRGDVRRAFCASRPPGHHAEADRAMGFCLFNNIAIAARLAQRDHGVGRIAIVDFDVHHGNGTQAVFEDDPSVLFISLHQHPRTCYPGTGYERETGVGAGSGFTLNIPMQPGCDDDDYVHALDQRVIPKLGSFKPDLLMISAGFDAHRDDPLAQMNLSEEAFEQMTRKLVEVANKYCGGRVVSVLEGGYNLKALGRSVVRHLIGLNSP
ncbi:MAG: histone deacetylase family protein [Tepidisphaeraceae bacterium]